MDGGYLGDAAVVVASGSSAPAAVCAPTAAAAAARLAWKKKIVTSKELQERKNERTNRRVNPHPPAMRSGSPARCAQRGAHGRVMPPQTMVARRRDADSGDDDERDATDVARRVHRAAITVTVSG
ncbi:hypothetical protein C8Q78DRAFT_1082564 [Trametes maxima]|nr:hypothetical protein C8Q78DRAFT_1082564 [Trametes maxima]